MKRAQKVDELWDFAVTHPEGFTWDDIREECPWAADRSHFFAIVRALRTTIGAEDTINLTCEPQGSGELWRYRLAGTYEDARPWNASRLTDIESRLVTVAGVSRSLAAASDGRSTDGRKSRLIAKVVTRLIEDLDELVHGPRLF